tara:strand:+ start:115 stop:654 length:540 start_codon:yes stop_codon:yes gene_type:complete
LLTIPCYGERIDSLPTIIKDTSKVRIMAISIGSRTCIAITLALGLCLPNAAAQSRQIFQTFADGDQVVAIFDHVGMQYFNDVSPIDIKHAATYNFYLDAARVTDTTYPFKEAEEEITIPVEFTLHTNNEHKMFSAEASRPISKKWHVAISGTGVFSSKFDPTEDSLRNGFFSFGLKYKY